MSRQGIMLCSPFEESRLKKWRAPYYIQPKLDGIRCRAIVEGKGNVKLLSSEENEILSVPHINAQLESLKIDKLELDGELYIHGTPFETIESIVSRTVNLHDDYTSMEYHVFDLIVYGGTSTRFNFKDVIFDNIHLPNVRNIRHFETMSLDDIMLYFDLFCKEGFEGFVLRNKDAYYERKRSTSMMKFKPKKNDLYRIIDTIEEVSITGQKKGTLGAIACISDNNVFTVGSGLTADQRRELWKERESLVGKWAEVQYQHQTTGKRVPRFPVFVRIVDKL